MTIRELIDQLISAACVLGSDAEVRLRPVEEFAGTRTVAKVKLVGSTAAICEDPKS